MESDDMCQTDVLCIIMLRCEGIIDLIHFLVYKRSVKRGQCRPGESDLIALVKEIERTVNYRRNA